MVWIRVDKVLNTQVSSNNLDVILIGLGMIIGFCIILMHLTGMWPCQLLDASGQMLQIDRYGYTDQPINKIIYDMHYWLKDLFQCS